MTPRDHRRRHRRTLTVGVATAVLSAGLVGLTAAPASAATFFLSLNGRTAATLQTSVTYNGILTGPQGAPIGQQNIKVLIDGQVATTATTGTTTGNYNAAVTFTSYGTHTVKAVAFDSVDALRTASRVLSVAVTPPAGSPTQVSDIATDSTWLYQGATAPQQDVATGVIDPTRIAVLHGTVHNQAANPISAVTVSIAGHPEYGHTQTRADGAYDMVVNGGQPVTVTLAKAGYLSADRTVSTPWRDYAVVADVVLVTPDPAVTTINSNASANQVARGNVTSDSDGSRRATLVFPAGTHATMTLANGSQQSLGQLHVHATEYTVGATGPAAMPADLPTTSAYTYAVNYTVDEAQSAGATTVSFDQPLSAYTENFLGFPAGTAVPAGYYDTTAHQWRAAADGLVIGIVAISAGKATVDTTGDGVADPSTYPDLGITDAERTNLAELYTAGTSLWRVPLTHFTTYDYNLAYGLPPGATKPDQHGYRPPQTGCASGGSIIGCTSQTLGEAVPLAGTPFALHYDTSRTPAFANGRSLDIGLTGSQGPSALGVDAEVSVAGRTFTQSFSANPNQRLTFTWDGHDVYGRNVYGSATASVSVGYRYQGHYYAVPGTGGPASGAGSPRIFNFGLVGDAPLTANPVREQLTVWQRYTLPIGALPTATEQDVAGWSLDVHHVYDPTGHTLYLGDGTVRQATNLFNALTTVAGTGNAGTYGDGTYTGDHAAAAAAGLSHIHGLAAAADGSVYLADTDNGVIRRIGPGGTITTFAGGGTPSGNGDGGPAIAAEFITPVAVAVGPDGSVYIADAGANRIRKVAPNGTISTVAGGGNPTTGIGDCGPATAAALTNPQSVAVAADGTVYIADTDHHRIRRLAPDGTITTAAGGGTPADGLGDGLPGPNATLAHPDGVAVDADGQVYIADTNHHRIRKLGTDGLITTLAGTGTVGTSGDDGPATAAKLTSPTSVSVNPVDRSILITQPLTDTVRLIDASGVISSLAGTGTAGFSGDQGPPAAAKLDHPAATVIGPDGRLWIADTDNFRLRQIAPPLPGYSLTDISVPSADGSELYQFDSTGRHLRTLDALTNLVEYTFGYTAGRLTTVTDHFSNVTTIDRDTAGAPTGIDSPYGQHTVLHVDPNGRLDTITDPTSASVSLGYGSDGLLASFRDPRNNTSTFLYDNRGRLTSDTAPDGKSTTLTPTLTDTGLTVAATTAEGHTTTYATTHLPGGGTRQTTTYPNGKSSVATVTSAAQQTLTEPDGSVVTATFKPDPRWGMRAPILSTVTQQSPSGATTTLSSQRTVTLDDPANPLSLHTLTDTATIGAHTTTSAYDATDRTITTTSPAGRRTITTLNTNGLPASTTLGTLASTTYSYDTHGRLTDITQGYGVDARHSSIDYGTNGYVSDVHDPLHTVHYDRDADGRVLTTTLPDAQHVDFGYDPNGNVTTITPAGQPLHRYHYTAGNQTQDYQPPQEDAAGNTTSYAYNNDRQPTTTALPDGRTLTSHYDNAGRLNAVSFSRGNLNFGYDPNTGQLNLASDPSGEASSFGYDGQLLTNVTTTGLVHGSVTYTYGAEHLDSLRVNSGTPQTYGYDADGNPTSVNGVTATYDPDNGYLTGTSIGAVTTSAGYDQFGEPAADAATVNGTTAYAASYVTDKLARLNELTETIGGTTTTSDYTYDARGRLTDVSQAGSSIYHYSYDANGNRTAATTPAGSVTAGYDSQDRLTRYGTTTYTYNATGQLTTATNGSAVTGYSYDELGHLTRVDQPDGDAVTYLYDGLGRRVAKKINGSLVQGFLYGDGLRPMATTDAQGIVTATYTYASGNTPDLITTSAATYRIVTDRLGSPRLIINTATGATVQHLDYDPFGNITTDTNPGFQPFGYTGGLADNDTGLLYLAARDYDPATGRFLTKDPTQFGGGDTNLYGYVGSDPVNYVDPTGLIFGIHCKTCREIASGTLHVVTAPGETIYNGFRREIYAYEHGCSYLDSIKYGIGGSIKGGFELALLLVAPEAEPEVVAAEDGAGALERASVSCGLSFSPDTLVLLADGESKPISELKVGDKVIGTDTKTGSSRARTVQAVLINHDTDLLDLVVIDRVGHRSIVHTTAKHPIWDDTTHRWVPAAHLPVKHLLHTADGRTMRVLEMVVPTITSGYMWDLTVEQDHDFYVKAGAAAILVHNCLGPVRLSEETRDTHILPLHGPGSPGLGSKLPATLEPEEYEAAANEVVRNSPIPSISQVGSHAHDWNGIRIWVDDLGNVLTMHGI